MSHPEDSLLLAPNLTLTVRWSARVTDFVEEWEMRQTHAHSKHPLEFWTEAARVALGGVEQGRHSAQVVIADLYSCSNQLPAVGDLLRVGPLELRVDQRHFITQRTGGVPKVEVQYYLGVEKYRYADSMMPSLGVKASILYAKR